MITAKSPIAIRVHLCVLSLSIALGAPLLHAQAPLDASALSRINITSTVTSAGSALVNLRTPLSVRPEMVKVQLNGKDAGSRLMPIDCKGSLCEEAVLTTADGLRFEKNVLTVNAGGGLSARLRFSGGQGNVNYGAAQARVAPSVSSVLPRSSVSSGIADPFLPPTVSVITKNPGGWDGNVDPVNAPWIRVGGQGYPKVQPSGICAGSIYLAVVLDRQTLAEKTAAPEASPQCIGSAAALKSYLAALNATDLVFVGTNYFKNPDPGLDTSAIGGTNFAPTGHISPVYPGGYMIIGAGGAAPGTAYQAYINSSLNYESVLPFATGLLQEDAYGNYNFQSSDVVEYTVSPNDPAYLSPNTNSAISIRNFAGGSVKNYVYTPPVGANGYWLLLLSRHSLATYPYSCNQGGISQDGATQYVLNCGTFYPTGSSDPAISKAAYEGLATGLSGLNSSQLVFLTTVGQAAYGGSNNIWQVAGFNGAYGGPSNGFAEFSQAVESLGGSPNLTQYLLSPTSAYTLVTSPGLGSPLTGSTVESTTTLSAQGQTGLVHGILQRDLYGLFAPEQTNQETMQVFQAKGGNNSPEYKLTEATLRQPVDWPSNSQTTLLASGPFTADSIAGQTAAYRYLSYVLLAEIYMRGITGSHLDDIHYFFTGSNNTAINFHTYDPLAIQWPNPATAVGPYVLPCESISGNICTSIIFGANDPLVFTQNDFLAVRGQISTEIRYLTDTLQFMVTGSTNMKAVIASGSANAGLALTGAASTILGSKLVPVPPTTIVTTSWQNIVSMIGGVASLASAIPGLGEIAGVIQLGTDAAKIFGGTSSVIGGIAGIAAGAGQITASSTSNSLPSAFGQFATDIGDLANGSMQGQLSSGFDTVTDSITSDWGRLSTTGPMIVDSNNPVFFSPNQVAQNVAVKGLTQAASRSFYLALLPDFYHVHYWQGVAGDTNTANDIPDMGYYYSNTLGNTLYCSSYYLNPQQNSSSTYSGLGATPANVSIWFPSPGGTPEYFDKDKSANAIDVYVIAGATTGAGNDNASIQVISPSLAANLFSNSGLNLPLAEFVVRNGPMSNVWVDAHAKNPASHTAPTVCDARDYPQVSTGVTGPLPGTVTTTTLFAPSSSVLDEDVTLKATVVAGSSPVTAGSMNFLDNGTIVSSAPLDATGTASATFIGGVTLGQHSLQAKYSRVDPYLTSSFAIAQLGVYADAPNMTLSSSTSSVQISSGVASSPINLQVTSLAGLAGTVTFACTGLAAGFSCDFSPSQTMLTGGGVATTLLAITKTTIAARESISALSVLSCLLLPMTILGFARRRKAAGNLQRWSLALLSGVLLSTSIIGCSESSPKTPDAVNSTVLISATAGSVTKTLPLSINVR